MNDHVITLEHAGDKLISRRQPLAVALLRNPEEVEQFPECSRRRGAGVIARAVLGRSRPLILRPFHHTSTKPNNVSEKIYLEANPQQLRYLFESRLTGSIKSSS